MLRRRHWANTHQPVRKWSLVQVETKTNDFVPGGFRNAFTPVGSRRTPTMMECGVRNSKVSENITLTYLIHPG